MNNIVRRAFCAITLALMAASAGAGVLLLPANEIVSNPPTNPDPTKNGHWWNLDRVFVNDSVFAYDSVFSNRLDTFRIAFADPGASDTLNRVITNVTMYVDNRVHYSKGGKLLLFPVYDGALSGYQSRVQKVGYAETYNKYDITLHDTIVSIFPDTTWHWTNVATLGLLYQPRTTGVIYFVDQVFATVTYHDTTQVANYRFAFSAVPSPQVVGVPFPVTVTALDSVGGTLTTFNSSASLWDSKAAVNPVFVTFTNGVSTFNAVVADTAAADTLFIGDGTAVDTSNGFAVDLGGVRRFDIDSVGSQRTGTAFPVIITASNYFGDPVTSFGDTVSLWDATGTLAPMVSPAFVNGVATAAVTVAATTASDTVFCSHALGNGQSNDFVVDPPVGVAGMPAAGGGAFWAALSPNPSVRDLRVAFNLPQAGRVAIAAYDILGRQLQSMDLGALAAGTHRLTWRHDQQLAAGAYFLRITQDGACLATRKILIVR